MTGMKSAVRRSLTKRGRVTRMILYSGGQQQKIDILPGDTVLTALHRHGIEVPSFCGGAGTCGKCKILVEKGNGGPTCEERGFLTKEELDKGIRLACYLPARSGLELKVDMQSDMEILTCGVQVEAQLDPLARLCKVKVPQPALNGGEDLASLLLKQGSFTGISAECLPVLADATYGAELAATVIGGQIVNLDSVDAGEISGVAIDIGTTTIAAYLMDLNTGRELAVCSLANPQRRYGADVIARINYAQKQDLGVQELRTSLVGGLNMAIKRLCSTVSRSPNSIKAVTIAANTVMLHMLLGANALNIANAPFTPTFTGQLVLRPWELGLDMAPHGQVVLLPGVSGYVGADITAGLLVSNFPRDAKWHGLFIDIGTNGEIVLGNGVQAVACSTAAGPAFEGANIKHGMPSVVGAISRFCFAQGKAAYKVIGDSAPRGICGSGLLSIVAELLQQGFIEPNGSFLPKSRLAAWQRNLLTTVDGLPSFVVTPGTKTNDEAIVLTQKDIRELQLAKGAIAAGVRVLMEETGISPEGIDQVVLAGGFGNSLSVEQAGVLGLIPRGLRDRVVKIGNGAGLGAKLVLLDRRYLRRAIELPGKIRYIELSAHSRFQTFFMEEMFFG